MEKVTISIFDCKPGMQIAQTLYNSFGAIMINKDTILDNQSIDRIKDMGIAEIEIYEADDVKVELNKEKNIFTKYKQNIADIKDIMSKVGMGEPLDMVKVNNITETILADTYSMDDFMGNLYDVGDVGDYNFTHSINVAFLAMTIGRWMNAKEETILHLTQAGLLHDIGKSKIPNEIIDKPGSLTQAEYKTIMQHPKHAYEILNKSKGLHKDVLLGVLTHHEREDGSGYPNGITSEKINLIAKIIAVADIYDAMTSERVYRKSQSPFEVFELMQNGSFGKLHPVILNTFIKNMSVNYVGFIVGFSNGEEGEVVFINPRRVSTPIVKIRDKYIDLSLEPNLKIKKIIKNDKLI